jgi:SnoaL-like protein
MTFAGPFEDRLAIRELLDAYSDAVCSFDADAWGATWAEGGVWEHLQAPRHRGM